MRADLATFSFETNLVLTASAGTGKTFTLIGLLARLLLGRTALGDVEPRRIVATTFSRKAAAEIEARLSDALERLDVEPLTSPYLSWLVSEDAAEAVGDVSRRARAARAAPSRVRVGTLHGFAASLVRAYPLELGLSPRLELTPEREAHARVEAAIQRALEALLVDDAPAARRLVDAAGGAERLVEQLRRVLTSLDEDGRSAAALEIDVRDAAALERQMGALSRLANGLLSDPKYGDTAGAFVSALSREDEAELEHATRDLLAHRIHSKKNPLLAELAAFRENLDGRTNAEKGVRLARAYALRHSVAHVAEAARSVLVRAEAELTRATRESGGLSFGEILRAARDLLRDHPEVAADVGAGLDALLVDEFQDTSRVQRELILLLWGREHERREAGSVPAPIEVRRRGLVVVGDRKQSIYGFRGADVSVFAELAIGLAGEEARAALGVPEGLAHAPREPSAAIAALRHNRRSTAPLLAFSNAFSRVRFVPGEPAQLHEIAYVPETEDLLPPPESADMPSAGAPPVTWLRVTPEKGASKKIDEALVIAQRIETILAERAPKLGADARAPELRDIAVLATSNAMLDATAFALAARGLPYVVSGRGFFRAREVRDVVAMLKLLLSPTDPLSLVEVLRGPWVGLHDESLLALSDAGSPVRLARVREPGSRAELVRPEDEPALAYAAEQIEALSRAAAFTRPGPLLREAVRAFSLDAVLSRMPRGATRVANVDKLLDLADTHDDPRALLHWLDDAFEREAQEVEAATFSERDDAVRLLTVHASKGLDFPIVFVPEIAAAVPASRGGAVRVDPGAPFEASVLSAKLLDADGVEVRPPSYRAAHEAERRRVRAERQRLAYVAITRAADAMFFVGGRASENRDDPGASTLGALQRLVDDDPEGTLLCVEDVTPPVAEAVGPVAEDGEASPADVSASRPRATFRTLAIAPTALADFAYCPRRFELVHLLGMPEHARTGEGRAAPTEPSRAGEAPLDARARGTLAHRVLERVPSSTFGAKDARAEISQRLTSEGVPVAHSQHRGIVERVARFLEGGYARRVAEAGASIAREVAFVLTIADAEGRELVLNGSMDLVVTWPDGAVDVVDYKSARGSAGEGASQPYAFQLDVYAEAARRRFGVSEPRVGLAFLGGDPSEPVWHDATPSGALASRLSELASRLAAARASGELPRVDLAACEAITCGFIGRCHVSTDRKPSLATTT